MQPPPNTAAIPDLVTFAIAAFAAVLGAEAQQWAEMLGPYSVIVLCGLGGAGFAAASAHRGSRQRTALYIVLMVGLALVLTVPLAEVVSRLSGLNVRWLLAPLAVLIAARPDYVLRKLREWWSGRTGQPPNDGSQA